MRRRSPPWRVRLNRQLRSALVAHNERTKMDVNINDQVMVKLTPYALTIMLETHFKLFNGARHAPRFEAPAVDAEGWSRMPMWRLMQEFGSAMYNGNPHNCFESNVIRLLGAA